MGAFSLSRSLWQSKLKNVRNVSEAGSDLFGSRAAAAAAGADDTKLDKRSSELLLPRPIEQRMTNGEQLWERDFSSMSSYELDVLKRIEFQDSAASSSSSLYSRMHAELEEAQEVATPFSNCCSGVVQIQDRRQSFAEARRLRRTGSSSFSFSAALPADLSSEFANGVSPLVKQSFDPFQDFRDSIEQIVEASDQDWDWSKLEELLYCYLSMNAAQHHAAIAEAFSQVMLDRFRSC